MSNKEKWFGKNLIFFAGVVSVLSTFFGCTSVLGLLWMQYPPKPFIPYMLLVAEFPLCLLATFVSKRFITLLWTIAFIYPLALILLARDIFISNSFMMFVSAGGTISFAFTAALLQYGGVSSTPPRKNVHDSKGVPYHRKF